jgi:hypothetical protein
MDKLLLQSKPMSEMSDDELRAGIAELQGKREALVADHHARRNAALAEAKNPKPKAPRAARQPDQFAVNMFATLKQAAEKKPNA